MTQQQEHTPLWSDDRIYEYVEAERFVILHDNRIKDAVLTACAEALAMEIRDDHQEELAAAHARVAELEAEVERQRARAESAREWANEQVAELEAENERLVGEVVKRNETLLQLRADPETLEAKVLGYQEVAEEWQRISHINREHVEKLQVELATLRSQQYVPLEDGKYVWENSVGDCDIVLRVESDGENLTMLYCDDEPHEIYLSGSPGYRLCRLAAQEQEGDDGK